MMVPHRQVPLAALAVVFATACGDNALEPAPDSTPAVRTILVHRQDTGENFFLNTEGTEVGTVALPTGLLPLGAATHLPLAVFVHDTVLVLASLEQGGRFDTIINPLPESISLASFSPDELLVAIVSYAPTRAILLYNRANRRVDTLPFRGDDPVLPPIISPDNERVALVSATQLSISLTILYTADPNRIDVQRLGFSKFLNRPIFGWPRWTEDGLHMAFVRVAGDGPDTLVAGLIDPDEADAFFNEQYRAVMSPVSDERPELFIGPSATYAFSSSGREIVLGATPGPTAGGRHAVYLVTPTVPRVQLLMDDPDRVLIFPLFIN
jgi:hypothetical protein